MKKFIILLLMLNAIIAEAQTFKQKWFIGYTKDDLSNEYPNVEFFTDNKTGLAFFSIRYTTEKLKDDHIIYIGKFDERGLCDWQLISYPSFFARTIISNLEKDETIVKAGKNEYITVIEGITLSITIHVSNDRFRVVTKYIPD